MTPATTTMTTPARAGGPARAPRNNTAAMGTRMIQMTLADPYDRPPDGIRLANSTTSPTTDIVAMSGVSRWFHRNSARATPNAATWIVARTTWTGSPRARSTSQMRTPTAMHASAAATAVRFRIRRSGSSAGSAPMSSRRTSFTDGLEHAGVVGGRANRPGQRAAKGWMMDSWTCRRPERSPSCSRTSKTARSCGSASPTR